MLCVVVCVCVCVCVCLCVCARARVDVRHCLKVCPRRREGEGGEIKEAGGGGSRSKFRSWSKFRSQSRRRFCVYVYVLLTNTHPHARTIAHTDTHVCPPPLPLSPIILTCARALSLMHQRMQPRQRRMSLKAKSSPRISAALPSSALLLLLLLLAANQLALARAATCSSSSGLPCSWCGCDFSKDASGTLTSTGSCPTCSDTLYLDNKGIKALSADVFANMGAMTCVLVVVGSRSSRASSSSSSTSSSSKVDMFSSRCKVELT